MRYKEGIDKNQIRLEPMCMDDMIEEGNICRVISVFTEQLDMEKLGYKYGKCKEKGCKPYDPRMMLNLYIYGYLNRINSSRRLEKETYRNIEVMWLMEGLKPDDKTICNFRKDNAKALKKTFREFSIICRKLGLYGCKLVAIDGTKIRANNSRKNNHNAITIEREISRIEKRINEYMNELEQLDNQEEEKSPTRKEIVKAIEKLKERNTEYKNFLSEIEEKGEVSTVDPDSKLMHQNGDGRKLDVCYNSQTVVDEKNSLIVDFEVTTRSDDKGNLTYMGELAKDVMDVEDITVLADKGYYDGKDIRNCERNGIKCLIAKPHSGGCKHEDGFSIEYFQYDKLSDSYVCPAGQKFKFMRKQTHSNGKEYLVYSNFSACANCDLREKCTKSKYRKILRLPYQEILDEVDNRTANNRELYKKRQEIVEHPFGTVKTNWGFRRFLCRSRSKVSAEMALVFLAYNLLRLINILKENSIKNLKNFGG